MFFVKGDTDSVQVFLDSTAEPLEPVKPWELHSTYATTRNLGWNFCYGLIFSKIIDNPIYWLYKKEPKSSPPPQHYFWAPCFDIMQPLNPTTSPPSTPPAHHSFIFYLILGPGLVRGTILALSGIMSTLFDWLRNGSRSVHLRDGSSFPGTRLNLTLAGVTNYLGLFFPPGLLLHAPQLWLRVTVNFGGESLLRAKLSCDTHN